MKPDWTEVVVHCPICGEAVELNVKVDDLELAVLWGVGGAHHHQFWGKAAYYEPAR